MTRPPPWHGGAAATAVPYHASPPAGRAHRMARQELSNLSRGGMKLGEPAIDLGIICAVVSSYRNLPVHEGTLIFGEVGLTGEVRGVSHVEQRLAEAIKMGFTRCIMPKTNAEVLGDNICQKIQVIGVSNVREVIQVL